MKIVIVGAGEVGFHIARQLILEHKDVILIEKNAANAKHAMSNLDCLVIHGEGTSIDTLIEADVKNADIFMAVTSSDEVNMISCLIVANEFKVPIKMARVRNIEYSKTQIFKQSNIGIDFVVNPEIEAAKSIIKTIEQGATTGVFSFDDMDVQLRDVFIDEDSPLIGETVMSIKQSLPQNFIIAGILREDDVIIPFGSTTIKTNDHLFLVGDKKSVAKFLKKSGINSKKIRKTMIVGAGKTGSYVARHLSERGRSVTVVDKDYDKCKELSEALPDVFVVHGDISEENIFEEEQLQRNDLIVTTTGEEELNMLTAIYAKTIGIKRSVALVNKTNYISIASNLGIDSIVSPKMSSVNAILKYTRKGNVKNVYNIFDGKAEAIEFSIPYECEMKNKKLMDLNLPDNSLIVAVNRHHRTYIPDGNFVLNQGDDVVIFAKKDAVEKLDILFSN